MTDKIRILSLFSGCGGMDLGLEGGFLAPKKSFGANETIIVDEKCINDFVRVPKSRFETVFANDILKDAQTAWVNYFSRFYSDAPERYHLESIVDLCKRHLSGTQVFPKNIDVVTGGFPCQDFSTAGKRRGFNSERGQLYTWMKQVIEIVRPKLFIAENVKGLVSLGDSLNIIRNDFASSGYVVVEPRILKAWEYGVPESRERVIFIGVRRDALKIDEKDLPDMYPQITHAFDFKKWYDNLDSILPIVTCKDVLSHLREPDVETDDLSQMCYSTARYLGPGKQGQTEIRWDGLGPTIRSEHHGNIEYRRLSAEHRGIMTDELNAGLKERRLTPRECALIQTFPPDYEFVMRHKDRKLSQSGAYRVIGNAVPPVLAHKIGQHISALWDILFD